MGNVGVRAQRGRIKALDGRTSREEEAQGEAREQQIWPKARAYFAEGELAVVGAVLRVPDQHLSIMLDPALAAQDVVDAGGHLIPFVVVPEPFRGQKEDNSGEIQSGIQAEAGGLHQDRRGGRAGARTGSSPGKQDIHCAHRDDFEGLAPEFIFPLHVLKEKRKKVSKKVQRETSHTLRLTTFGSCKLKEEGMPHDSMPEASR